MWDLFLRLHGFFLALLHPPGFGILRLALLILSLQVIGHVHWKFHGLNPHILHLLDRVLLSLGWVAFVARASNLFAGLLLLAGHALLSQATLYLLVCRDLLG